MTSQSITVLTSEAGQRIDLYLADRTGITRSQLQKYIVRGDVLVNQCPVSTHYRVRADDAVTITIPRKSGENLTPEPVPIEILYRDKHVVVVNKPSDMVVYPSAGNEHHTLMNALAYHCGKLANVGSPLRPGVVHRLDKDTSGIMVVALDDKAYYDLVEQFRMRTIKRKYIALVSGDLRHDSGEVSSPIGRSESDRKKMSTKTRKGREALTRWKVLRRFPGAALIEVKLGTGRTHQIRVHLSSIGHPVLGDKTYGRKTVLETGEKKILIPRQMLHAETLGFTHPSSGEYLEFSSTLPEDMRTTIAEIETFC